MNIAIDKDTNEISKIVEGIRLRPDQNISAGL
jgi:hypothetical protein